MHVSARFLFLCVLLAAVFFSPIAVGAVAAFPSALVAGALLAFALYAFSPARSLRLKQAALVPLSLCFAVTLFDLSARPLLFYLFDVRPTERFYSRWPPLPLLGRYIANVKFEGVTYGDLAAVSGRKDWREERRVRFVTDADGFRNNPTDASDAARPLDVIVLGDSFGVAGGTSQEDILSSLLAREYGLSVYNLSISKESPQQEYASLLLEGHRLRTRAGTCVLWLIFTGNDLDEPYYKELFNPQPRLPSLQERLVTGINDFRSRSPVSRLLSPVEKEQVIEKTFIDGRRVLFFAPYVKRRNRTAEEIERHPNFESLKATLAAMEKLAGERSLTIEVALVPSKEEVYSWMLDGGASPWSNANEPSGFSVVMRELCVQHGFRYLDLKPSLVGASRRVFEETGALLWWRDDTHWNGAGQRVAAAVINESLQNAEAEERSRLNKSLSAPPVDVGK